MGKLTYKIKSRFRRISSENLAQRVFDLVREASFETLIYSPILDFEIIPSGSDLKKFTSSKVDNLIIEIGSGNGDFLVYLAKKYKKSFVLGFEIAKDYYLKSKNNLMRNLCLNAKISHQEAFKTLKNKFVNDSVSKIYINFPDPWPKKKHWRRRFITSEKFPTILSKLEKNGEIIFVTDHMGYADFVEEICKEFKKGGFIVYSIQNSVPEEYPETKYFRKWKKLGKKEYRTILMKKT